MSTRERLIVALDLPDRDRILKLAGQLAGRVAMVKIGLEAFVAHGPELVHQLRRDGSDVLLDLKIHDIPRTAAAAAREAGGIASLITVHAAGGIEMIRAVRDATDAATQIMAVTMLTSLDEEAATTIGFAGGVQRTAVRLGRLAREAGADGLVCSTHELEVLAHLGGSRLVPGVRPAGSRAGDQKRIATPRAAVDAGATWIVVGRPILEAEDPLAVVEQIDRELAVS